MPEFVEGRPVKTEDPLEHRMDEERYIVPEEAAGERLMRALAEAEARRVVVLQKPPRLRPEPVLGPNGEPAREPAGALEMKPQ